LLIYFLFLHKLSFIRTQSNLATEQEDVSEESEVEENTPSQSQQGQESGHDFQDSQLKDDDVLCRDTMVNDTETTKQRLNDFKLVRNNKKQKQLTDTPCQQMVQILKENAELRKRKYEEKNSIRSLQSRPTTILENLDDTDLFF